jgi:hypothetical protein
MTLYEEADPKACGELSAAGNKGEGAGGGTSPAA